MKKAIIEDLNQIISGLDYGDLSKNEVVRLLESAVESIEEHLIEEE
jgi:exonuclease VII small subunit